ncbi:MAG: ATP-binding protein, partial [Clostridium sp.]|nr:ATP-binding protein [Clostridium sp.]
MRYITKLHLINWHYIEFKTLDLSKGINFLTGETGAGKSTILDALQLVILGDLRGHYFNKAANENSKRRLIEYLRGMTQDNTDEGKKCIRDNIDFNSYIVIEVLNSETKETFCLGVVFEVRKDSNNYDHLFFKLKGYLPESGFLKNKQPLSIKELKEQYGGLLRGHTREEYNEHFLYEYMGKLKKGFFDVFKRSVAFKPPASIEEFIQKFICDDTKIDVEDMVTPIRIYKKIEKEAEKVQNQIKDLKIICDEYEKFEKIMEQYSISKFIYDRSELELENIKSTKLREEINDAEQFIERESNRLNIMEDDTKKLEKDIDNLKNKIENSRETVLRKEINDLNNKVNEFKGIQRMFTAEAIRFERWINCIQDLSLIYCDLYIDAEQYKRDISQMKLYNLKKESFSELNQKLSHILRAIID